MCLRRISSTCCRNSEEACCSSESLPPALPPPSDRPLVGAAAGVGAAAPNSAATVLLRLSSVPRFSFRALAAAAPLLNGRGVSIAEPAAAVPGCIAALPAASASVAGVPKRVRMLSSRPPDLERALCCSTLRSATLRSYFCHCSKGRPGGGVRQRRRQHSRTKADSGRCKHTLQVVCGPYLRGQLFKPLQGRLAVAVCHPRLSSLASAR